MEEVNESQFRKVTLMDKASPPEKEVRVHSLKIFRLRGRDIK
jgi:hypothetical protein